MLKKMFASALFAGFAAGLIVAALQIVFVVPVIQEAERYETGALSHFGPPPHEHAEDEDADHDHPVAALAQGTEFARPMLTALATIATNCGFALLLVAGFALAARRGERISARTGLIWGLAGFIAFQLAPAAGLAPELPGSAAAGLAVRQIWWSATVALAIAGLALIGFGRSWASWGAGLSLLALPHLIGAPQPLEFAGVVPPELAGDFVGKALAVSAAGWAVLGLFAAWFWHREMEKQA